MTNLAAIKAELAAGRERLLHAIGGVTEEVTSVTAMAAAGRDGAVDE